MKKQTIHVHKDSKSKNDSTVIFSRKILSILLLITLGIAYVVWGALQHKSQVRINDFKTCKEAGYPIMESYPAQCMGPNKKVFTEVIPTTTDSPLPSSSPTSSYLELPQPSITKTPYKPDASPPFMPYKGTALGSCNADNDCVTNGCNREICQSKDAEPMMSTCEYRDDTPLRQGYTCGCVQNECAWRK